MIDQELKLAILWNNKKVVSSKIHNLSMLNDIDNDGNTPLMIAAQKGNIEIFDIILNAGADLDKKNFEGETALDIAKSKNNTKIVQRVNDVLSEKYLLSNITSQSDTLDLNDEEIFDFGELIPDDFDKKPENIQNQEKLISKIKNHEDTISSLKFEDDTPSISLELDDIEDNTTENLIKLNSLQTKNINTIKNCQNIKTNTVQNKDISLSTTIIDQIVYLWKHFPFIKNIIEEEYSKTVNNTEMINFFTKLSKNISQSKTNLTNQIKKFIISSKITQDKIDMIYLSLNNILYKNYAKLTIKQKQIFGNCYQHVKK